MLADAQDLRGIAEALGRLAEDDDARGRLDRALEEGDVDAARAVVEEIVPSEFDPFGWHCIAIVLSGIAAGPKVEEQWEARKVCWAPGGARLDRDAKATLGEQLPRVEHAEHLIEILEELGIIHCGLELVRKDPEQQTLFEFSKTYCW